LNAHTVGDPSAAGTSAYRFFEIRILIDSIAFCLQGIFLVHKPDDKKIKKRHTQQSAAL
jgi:hypothetical protein